MHRSVMLDPARCCICRRRLLLAWLLTYPRYLGMRCHRRCYRAQMDYLQDIAPFKATSTVRLVEGKPEDDNRGRA